MKLVGRGTRPTCSPQCFQGLAAKIAKRHAQRLGIKERVRTFSYVKLEFGKRKLTALPLWRRRAFEEHLRLMLAPESAPTEPEPDPVPPPKMTPLLEKVCAFCKGGCCTYAREHAYLKHADLAQQVTETRDVETIVGDYLDRLPARSYHLSCVYHGPTGCVLPRELRSSMCNTYECSGIAGARQGEAPVFVSIMNERFGFVDENSIRPIRKP